ncbi:MAG: poly-beta-1,6 N-acetyl-D-glucosamine synthase [Gammaproteobacteria bacterium]|nr:poly-beta-1,6 N-acetyl-D-glucosamine synthase [Gammaproteobacteria bacterium]
MDFGHTSAIFDFAYYYPLFMGYLWIIAALVYYFHWERKDRFSYEQMPRLKDQPPVSFIVPCHNEGDNCRETIDSLLRQNYPEFEIIAINDCSSDDTGAVLDDIQQNCENVRVIHFAANQGKGMGLRMGALTARHEFLVCLDGDALLHPNATLWLMRHFVSGPRVGAVTGNPRVRNRTTLLGKIQVCEFSSIIGLIKRAQRIYGRVFTVSGVVSAFRKTALHHVGYWNLDMVTEDIDVSWRLQLNHWDIRYEPRAVCWILMPEKLIGLWRQRLRWSQGGLEVLRRYWRLLFKWRSRRMWLVSFELMLSTFWAHVMGAILLLWIAGKFLPLPETMQVPTVIPGWAGVILGFTCLLQFAVSLTMDGRYEPRLGRFYYWMIWYPMIYWVIQAATTIVAFPRAMFRLRGRRAIWTSPDRGLRPPS